MIRLRTYLLDGQHQHAKNQNARAEELQNEGLLVRHLRRYGGPDTIDSAGSHWCEAQDECRRDYAADELSNEEQHSTGGREYSGDPQRNGDRRTVYVVSTMAK